MVLLRYKEKCIAFFAFLYQLRDKNFKVCRNIQREIFMRNIAILTSGGDTPGMNAAIYAAVRTIKENGYKSFGVMKGYAGLMEGRIEEIRSKTIRGIATTGGTILKTARCAEMRTKEGQQKAVEVLRAFEIDGLVVVGGDGSFMGAHILSHMGVPAIGVPGTIDNDLAYTEYTIGFDTAVNCVIQEIERIRDTMNSHERIGIIEVMGNKCGDIALNAGLAGGAEYILLPEKEFDVDKICSSLLKRKIKGQMTSLILIAEGAGKGEALANYIRAKTSLDAKAIVLGHVQRGGEPTFFDRKIAITMAIRAVELLIEGAAGRVVGISNNKVMDMDIDEALACKMEFDDKLYAEHKMLSKN